MMGKIFEVKRFAIHDGPGIRTTLFLKGCPLCCPWCQNPEGMSATIKLWHKPAECLQCGSCVAACPDKALKLADRIHIEQNRCIYCGQCLQACPVDALSLDGWETSEEEAVALLMKDKVFFEDGGGITLSGGELFAQWRFSLEVLRRCKDAGADTAIESCMLVDQKLLLQFLPVVDHFIMDIKYYDADLHRSVLGADNRPILENYAFLASSGADVLVRTPLIPGYTATEDNIRAIARYLVKTDPNARYELLNFNPLCRSKYSALDRHYPISGNAFSTDEMNRFYAILAEESVRNIIRE